VHLRTIRARLAREQVTRAEQEGQLAKREADRQRKLVTGLAIAFATVAALAGLAGWQWQVAQRSEGLAFARQEEAQRQRNRAVLLKLSADQQRELARRQTAQAVAACNTAQAARRDEAQQRLRAQEQAERADRQTTLAENQRHRAESERRLAENAQRVAEQERQNACEQAVLAAREAERAARLESKVDILRMQGLLSDLYGVRLIKDGTIGPTTVHWLKQFQADMGIDVAGEFDEWR
jgi:colicin import membrane protein